MSEKIVFSVKDGKLTAKKEFMEFIKKHIVAFNKLSDKTTLDGFDCVYIIIDNTIHKAILSRRNEKITLIVEYEYKHIFGIERRLRYFDIEDGDTIYMSKDAALKDSEDTFELNNFFAKENDINATSKNQDNFYWKAEYYQNINGNEKFAKYEKSGDNYFVNDKKVSKIEFDEQMSNYGHSQINGHIQDTNVLKSKEQQEKDDKITYFEKELKTNDKAILELNTKIETLQTQIMNLQKRKEKITKELNELKK